MADTKVRGVVTGTAAVAAPTLVWHKRASIRSQIGRAVFFALAAVGAISYLVPFVWAISTSLKTPAQIFVFPPEWIPNPVQFSNYPKALNTLPFGTFLVNSTIITFTSLVGDVGASVIVAYGFARLRFVGRNFLFMVLLATMMLPSQVTLIPVYIIFNRLGMVDTFYPLIIPSFFGNAFYIFLLRQFYLTIPFDLEDSARIDGASRGAFLWHILIPLSGPVIATVAVFSFLAHWQEFFRPLIYLNSREKLTIPLGLRMFQSEYAGWQWEQLMAVTVLTTIPSIVLYFVAQRYFVSGIVMTGMKG